MIRLSMERNSPKGSIPMNRTWPFVQSSWRSAKTTLDVQSGLFATSSQDTIYTLFTPLHYEPRYSYPLIVWLHGYQSDERQLTRIMPLVSMRNYVAVAPRGTLITDATSPSGCFGWQQGEEQVSQAETRIFDSIDQVTQKLNIARQRTFLAGFDCGGTMAFRVAMKHPRPFAGVLSLGGSFPTGCTPLSKLTAARRLLDFLSGRPAQHGVSARQGLRRSSFAPCGRPVDYLAGLSLRSGVAAADALGHGSLGDGADPVFGLGGDGGRGIRD